MLKKKFIWQKIRWQASEALRRLLMGRLAGGLPGRSIRSIEASMFRDYVSAHVDRIVPVLEPAYERYAFERHLPVQFRRGHAFDARHAYYLSDVYVSPHSGLTWTPQDWLFEESAGAIDRIMAWGWLMPELLLGRRDAERDELYLVVPAAPFYHFMWEHLPAIAQALRLEPTATLLLPDPVPTYVTDALTLLLGAHWQTRSVSSKKSLRVRRLLMPQIEPYSGFIHPGHLQEIRRIFSPVLEGVATEANRGERLYVSRRQAIRRRMAGEAELEDNLRALGFTVLYAEQLPLAEQATAFARAQAIVAPHGAGLSHLAVVPEGAYVLEIFPHDYFNDCYARLAMQMGHNYDYLQCNAATGYDGGALPSAQILAKVKAHLGEAVVG